MVVDVPNQVLFLDRYMHAPHFRVHFSSSLKSLDLSYNSLTEVPLASLARMSALDWLNLHR